MSRSNPTATNPSTRFMEWKGGAEKVSEKDAKGKTTERYDGGKVTYYDKENKENVEVALPFSFIVLDELNTITGYSESLRSGFWANEVRDLKNDIITVKAKSGNGTRVVAQGTYSDIKDEIKAQGGKYTKSVYIAYKDDQGELAIGHIKIAGSALTAWIEFQKQFDVMKCAVFITDEPKLEKKGSNYYFSPVFDGQNVSAETEKIVQGLDKQLQGYLDTYMARRPEDAEEIEDDEEIADDEPATETASQPEAEESPQEPAPKAVPANGGDDDKINLKDVPF